MNEGTKREYRGNQFKIFPNLSNRIKYIGTKNQHVNKKIEILMSSFSKKFLTERNMNNYIETNSKIDQLPKKCAKKIQLQLSYKQNDSTSKKINNFNKSLEQQIYNQFQCGFVDQKKLNDLKIVQNELNIESKRNSARLQEQKGQISGRFMNIRKINKNKIYDRKSQEKQNKSKMKSCQNRYLISSKYNRTFCKSKNNLSAQKSLNNLLQDLLSSKVNLKISRTLRKKGNYHNQALKIIQLKKKILQEQEKTLQEYQKCVLKKQKIFQRLESETQKQKSPEKEQKIIKKKFVKNVHYER